MKRMMALLAGGLLILSVDSHAEELDCLAETDRAAAALYAELQQEAYEALERRRETCEQLTSRDQIEQRQQQLRDFFTRQLGGFPKRTPLNGQVVGRLNFPDYRIEKVIYESQPNHHVTANLYLPVADQPVPGIVVSSGHSRTGKTADYNQRFGIMMARHGMAALCFDPIGQGERSQILDAASQPKFGGTTTEHFLIGVGSILVGRNTARYRVWDAMRAIDYLASRPEVDATRIGFTGCSGGGTLTSYVMALDDRVACAAPACYLTTFRRLIETIGPQDAEQNIFGQVAAGMDHPDYVLMRAPRPTLISSTTSDFFDIQGSWDNYRQSKRVFGQLGYPERVDLVEVAGKHGVQPQNLATITHWFQRWLLDVDQPVPITELETLPPASLLCLDAGQVLTMPAEKSVFDLNAEYEAELKSIRTQLWESNSAAEMSAKVGELIALGQDSERKPPTWEDLGRVKRDNYHIDKVLLRTAAKTPLPALTFHPADPVDAAYLYLHDDGKRGDSEPGGQIEKLVAQGFVVVAVDLRGQGETSQGKRDATLTDWKTFFLSYLLGKSLVGVRTEDALAAADFVAHYQKQRDDPREVHLVGVGQAGIVALHAAAMNPARFASVTLRGTPREWSSLVQESVPAGQLDSTVHAALTVYDLPDLVRLIGPDKVRLESRKP